MATLYDTPSSELRVRHRLRRDAQPGPMWWPGSRLHDVHTEPVGNFAGRVAPGDPVGTFGNVQRLRRQGKGTFRGDADRQREGSFADQAFPHAA